MVYVTAKEIMDLLLKNNIYLATGNIKMSLHGIDVIIKENDIIGNALQEWLGEFLNSQDIYFRKSSGQTFPDLYLSESDYKNLCEIKTFRRKSSPAFDISTFRGSINSLRDFPYRLDADYLIFGYDNDENGNITIKDIWHKKVWEITGATQEFCLNCQRKNNQIVNIRPVKWFSERAKNKPFTSKEEYVVALYETHKSEVNSIKEAKRWLDEVIDGYKMHTGEDMKSQINILLKKRDSSII